MKFLTFNKVALAVVTVGVGILIWDILVGDTEHHQAGSTYAERACNGDVIEQLERGPIAAKLTVADTLPIRDRQHAKKIGRSLKQAGALSWGAHSVRHGLAFASGCFAALEPECQNPVASCLLLGDAYARSIGEHKPRSSERMYAVFVEARKSADD